MNTFNVYKINSALSETDPVIMIGQEEGYGNIRRIIPNPKHPVPGFALTPQVITRSDPRLVIRKIGSYADFKSAFNAASRVVNTLKLAQTKLTIKKPRDDGFFLYEPPYINVVNLKIKEDFYDSFYYEWF